MKEKFILPTFSTAVNQLKDLDGNVYTTVIIGTQEWIVENWRCTKYADGSAIPNIEEAFYDDWFLPSKDEFTKIKENLYDFGVGGIALGSSPYYWTSSENSDVWAWGWSPTLGYAEVDVKSGNRAVRACRTFTAAIGVYVLRDTGPAGGLIFYIDGTTYYEAAPSDQSASQAWSNITDVLIGTTGTAIGTGAANTAAIIAQVGHTDSAAKLCDDLSAGGWINDTAGAYCAYDNDTDNIAPYGLLYNWPAVDNASGLVYLEKNGVQELGWEVATDTDWTTLTDYIGGLSVAGGKLKEAGIEHWKTPNTDATDEVGFTALPGGIRSSETGVFRTINDECYWWCATAYSSLSAWVRWIDYGSGTAIRGSSRKGHGFSVRLVRDVS